MVQRYTIDTIEIEGFRGYLDKLVHNLRNRSSIIFLGHKVVENQAR